MSIVPSSLPLSQCLHKMSLAFHSWLFLLLHLVPLNLALYCRACTQHDPNCKMNPQNYELCEKKVKACFWYYHSDRLMERGCARPNNLLWQQCLDNNMLDCFICRYSFCNTLPFRINRTLLCHQSTKGFQDTVDVKQVTPCAGERALATPDFCYTIVGRDRKMQFNALDRGCGPYTEPIRQERFLYYCGEDGCNIHGDKNGMMCSDGQSSLSLLGPVYRLVPCYPTTPPDHLPALCIRYNHGGDFREGCLNKLAEFRFLRDCAFHYYTRDGHLPPRVCQTCSSHKCNKAWTKPDYRILHQCRNLANQPVTCSMIPGFCYLHLEQGKPTAAGCVEPTVSPAILRHQNTHICNVTYHSYTGCFDLTLDYSSLLSCYQCGDPFYDLYGDCTNIDELQVQHRTACPLGTKFCIAGVKDKQVFRGCYDERSEAAQFCHANYGECLYCNTNLCNGLPMQENKAKCYDTYIPGTNIHSTTLRMRSCRNLLPAYTEKPCFIAKREGSVIIQAGCVENLDTLRPGYRVTLSGKTDIIFEERITCYKCRSDVWGNCNYAKNIEPRPCSGNARSAYRGCYTLFDSVRQRVERGCVSELDEYHLGFCFTMGYEELCILCTRSNCNSHTVD